jgi:hypothetical protein
VQKINPFSLLLLDLPLEVRERALLDPLLIVWCIRADRRIIPARQVYDTEVKPHRLVNFSETGLDVCILKTSKNVNRVIIASRKRFSYHF